MNPSRPFILRPIATSLLMAGLLLVGAVAYKQLPVSALPQVDYPTIQVMTFYPGASPDVMTSAITAPLERQFGQVPGLKQMTSTSSGGSSVITLQFGLDLNIDVAEQEVQAAINAASTFLPRDLPNPPIYSKINPADAPILTLALDLEDVAAVERGGSGRYAPGAEDLAAARRWVWSASAAAKSRPCAFRPTPRRCPPTVSRWKTCAAALPRPTSIKPKATSMAPSGLHDRRQRSAPVQQRLQSTDRRLPERRAGAALRCRRRSSTVPRTSSRRPG